VYLSPSEQEFESNLLLPQLRTVKGQPELMLISWVRLTVVTDRYLTHRNTEVGCMSAYDATDGVGKQTDTE